MLRAYRMLLRLYPCEYRLQFADEMLAVFARKSEERRAQGRLAYARFLGNECAGLLSGICVEQARRRVSLAPALGGIVVAAALYAAFFAFVSVVRGAALFVRPYILSPADPLADSVALCFFGMASLLSLLPVFILLTTRLTRRRR